MAKKILIHTTLVTLLSLCFWFFAMKVLSALLGVEIWELGIIFSSFVIMASTMIANIAIKVKSRQ
jgi:hypothetical protein